MQEDFLHYIWKYRLFDNTELTTTNGLAVEIISVGTHNFHSGPDFHTARIRIGDTEWAGNLEIHIKASDWYHHGHQRDPAYDNVILHVVWENDKEINSTDGRYIPAIELKGKIQPEAVLQWEKIRGKKQWIPCGKSIQYVPSETWPDWLDTLLDQRLERRSEAFLFYLEHSKNDWEVCFYRSLCERFGLRTNNAAFRLLAVSVPFKVIAKKKGNVANIEAMLFGQAGMLHENMQDDYGQTLFRDYTHYKHLYQLEPLPISIWKKARMRPGNFPAVRIAQLAMLLQEGRTFFKLMLETDDPKILIETLRVKTSNYWTTHYVFDKKSKAAVKQMGRASAENLLINTVVPFLYSYGKYRNEPRYKEKAIQMLKSLKPEKNQILRNWESLGVAPKNAGDTQALLELKNNFCSMKKCLSCAIAENLLKQ